MQGIRIVLFLLLTVLGGCLELEQTITLEADGSGKQQLRMAMRETTLADITRASAAAQTGGSNDTKALFDRELAKQELEAAGFTMTEHVAKTENGKRRVDLTAAFKDFATLQKSPLCGSAAEWTIGKGPKPGTAKLTLYPQGKQAWVDARAKAEAMQKEPDAVAADFFRKKQDQLTGLDLTLRFKVPGDVLGHTVNLDKTGDREVTARITAEQIKTPQDLVRRLAPRFEVVFNATGCKLPIE